jgi:hypothetical protein
VLAEAQQERQQLAAAAGPAMQVLAKHRQRWVVRTWQAAVRQLQVDHQLVSCNSSNRRQTSKCIGMTRCMSAPRRDALHPGPRGD